MSRRKKPSFSDGALYAAEAFQSVAKHFRLGRTVVSAVSGSRSPAYEQLIWLPPWKINYANVAHTVRVSGNRSAGRMARNWGQATVLAAPRLELRRLQNLYPESSEAVAYRSAKAWHVGVSAVKNSVLSAVEDDLMAVAVRIGTGDAEFSVGRYDPHRKHYISVERGLIELNGGLPVPVESLPSMHPGVKLV